MCEKLQLCVPTETCHFANVLKTEVLGGLNLPPPPGMFVWFLSVNKFLMRF